MQQRESLFDARAGKSVSQDTVATHPIYEYKVIPVDFIHNVSKPAFDMPDAYLSKQIPDPTTVVEDLLAEGFRWVRTEGKDAIMEKVSMLPINQERIQ